MIASYARIAACLLFVSGACPASAGKGAFLPTYHPKPCSGGDCKADDPRSGLPCQGFLCQFGSARAMQPPVTAEAAEALEKARAAAAVPLAVAAKPKRKHAAKPKRPPA